MAQTETQKIRATAHLRYLHIAPRKVRLVADTVRGLSALEAEAQLAVSPRRASVALLKLLRSAMHNAKRDGETRQDNLFISHISVDDGPVLKRVEYRARGTTNVLRKGMSHVSIELAERDTVRIPRYRVAAPEKKAKQEKVEKETAKKGPVSKAGAEHVKGGRGGLKRMFRRKSV